MLSAPLLRATRAAARVAPRQTRAGSSAGPHYNQPSGYLFGEKPVKGQRRKMEDWELPIYVFFFGGCILAGVGQYYKPDTSIQTWALQEAKKRMEARGEATEYKPTQA